MKMIILAAGQGTRLRPFTNDKPKCMVEYKSKPIIDYILDVAKECNIKDIALVSGYKKDVLENYLKDRKLVFYTNENFDKTNMVSTLFHARKFMDDDLIISYSDIVYNKEILQKLIFADVNFGVVVDKDWKSLWSLRMENPLEDAETLKIVDGNIVEIGKKPKSYDHIEGQYIGLIKISGSVISNVINFYENLDVNMKYDGQNFDNMYMTSFIQMITDGLLDVKPVQVYGGWIEIDTVDDLLAYEGHTI